MKLTHGWDMKIITPLVLGLFLPTLLLFTGCASSRPGYAYEHVENIRRDVGKVEAAQWAEKVRPYAAMSELAYQGVPPNLKPAAELKLAQNNEVRHVRQVILREELKLAGWQLLNHCDDTTTNENSEGLHFYIWKNQSLPQPRLVVAFRGTESWDWSDWRSNFRWLLPFFRSNDQYNQARKLVFEYLQTNTLASDTNLMIITTGHSLGAGLAQAIFYTSYAPDAQPVTQCYAFDPSPVTGALQLGTFAQRSVARAARNQMQAAMAGDKVKGESSIAHYNFGIARVYERGEILAIARYATAQFFPLFPVVSEVRFNFEHSGGLVGQHSMSNLAWSLYKYDLPTTPKP
jgi:hypothetical protein